MKEFLEDFLKKNAFSAFSLHLIFIVVAGFLVYSNTFYAPFELDDKRNIIDNPAIKSFEYFKSPSMLQEVDTHKEIKKFFESRYIGYLSFAINYLLHGVDVFGYHLFNVSIHIINALLVYWLVILIFKTPIVRDVGRLEQPNIIAFFSALIFAVHPIETQAVTYIVQRFASLATLFYLLSLVFYIKSRLITINSQRSAVTSQKTEHIKLKTWAYYCGSVISAVLAMKTKEISFTLPVMVTLYEFMFFEGKVKKRLLYLMPIILTMSIIPLTFISARGSIYEFSSIGKSFEVMSSEVISRWDYLLTQFRVVVTYMRLMLLPVGQNLDYDYPIYKSFFEPQVLLSFLLLLSIFGIGIYLFYRSRFTSHDSRLTAFGIFWFFITLSVESGVIPITDVIFEHRMYLPSAGFIIAVVTSLMVIKNKLQEKFVSVEKAITPILIMIVIILSGTAYARNGIWQTEIGLWEDVVRKSYGKTRPHYNLGLAYSKGGKFNEAIKEFLHVSDNADFDLLRYNLGWAYFKKNMLDDAVREYLAAIRLNPNYTDAYINLGAVYINQDRFDDAIEALKKAIAIKPDDIEAHYNLGGIYEAQGLLDSAVEEYMVVSRQRSKFAEEHNNIGVELFRQGRLKEAERKYRIAIGLKPDMDQPHYNLGLALKKMGRLDEAVKELKETIRLKPNMERAYYNLGLIYKQKRLVVYAREAFQTALKLMPDYHDARRELESLK